MGQRAATATLVPELVRLAVPLLQEAERTAPRTGPGAKPVIPDWVLAGLIMIALLHKKKTKSAQYRYLRQRRPDVAAWLGDRQFPSRATYFRRYRRAHGLYREAVRLQGQAAIDEGLADPRCVAVDKSLVAAPGPPWHVADRQAGKAPAGVDIAATWGYSEHDGWVFGYSFEVVVSATPGTLVFPLLASADTASASEAKTFAAKIDQLPAGTQAVLADSGYDVNDYGERLEYDEQGRRTGRRFLCPENPRNTKDRELKPPTSARQALSRRRRSLRRRHLKSRRGRRLYRRRSKTAEPFNQWLKSLFELDGRVWHRGLDNNRTQLLGAIFAYQLLVRYNHRHGNPNGKIRWILDTL
jgi:hypothetical protein